MTWHVDEGERCAVCAAPATDLHHIVPRRMTSRGHTSRAWNGMPLCRECHRAHHERTKAVPRAALTPVQEAFAAGAAGEGWLDLWYPMKGTE